MTAPDDYDLTEQARAAVLAVGHWDEWSQAHPSLANAAECIAQELGIGRVAAAQVIVLYRDWIGQ